VSTTCPGLLPGSETARSRTSDQLLVCQAAIRLPTQLRATSVQSEFIGGTVVHGFTIKSKFHALLNTSMKSQ